MKILNIILILAALLLIDLIKPFGYHLKVELLFIGIIYAALNLPLAKALIVCIFFGFCKDSFLDSTYLISTFEFPILAFLIRQFYLRIFFKSTESKLKISKAILLLSALVLHILINSLVIMTFNIWFSVLFILQSLLLFLAIDSFLNHWLKMPDFE